MLSEPFQEPGQPQPQTAPPPVGAFITTRTAAERQALHAAQERLRHNQIQDRERRVFEATLRSTEQPFLLRAAQARDVPRSDHQPQLNATGRPESCLQLTQRVPAKPLRSKAEQRLAGESVTSPSPISPAELTQAGLPEVERIMRERLQKQTQARWVRSGKPGNAPAVRKDRIQRNLTVIGVLMEAAYVIVQARGQQAEHVTSYTYFTVLDLLTVPTGLSVSSCEKATFDLRACGLMATHSAKADAEFLNARGQRQIKRVKTGVWICVELRPRDYRRAMIFKNELPLEPPRDLAADRKAGRTAWQIRKEAKGEVRESVSAARRDKDIYSLVQWALNNQQPKESVKGDSLTSWIHETSRPKDVVWGLRTLLSEHPQRRTEAVQQAAQGLARLFDDQRSLKHYYQVLWRAVNAEFEGLPAFGQLETALCRTLDAMQESKLRRPGGYAMKLLGELGWLDAVYRRTKFEILA